MLKIKYSDQLCAVGADKRIKNFSLYLFRAY